MNKIPKVLVVDDDPYVLMSLEFLMKKSGYDVLVGRNGTETMELLYEHKPDIMLLDIMMPDIDGYAICEHVKSTGILSHCKVVFVSAKSKESDIQKGYDLGASLYITKPFSNKNLVKQIHELLV